MNKRIPTILDLTCTKCYAHFSYERKYSYIRKLCDACGAEVKRNQALALDAKAANEKAVAVNKQREYPRGVEHHNYDRITKPCRVCAKPVERVAWYQNKSFSCSKECDREWRKKRYAADGNPSWRGGDRMPYPSSFKHMREIVRERDGFACQECGMREVESFKRFGCRLSVHYINYIKDDCRPENLISLCIPCHSRIKTGDMQSLERLTMVMEEKYTHPLECSKEQRIA